MLKYLQKTYPTPINKWKTIIIVSLFVAIFLPVFQPFGLQFVELEYKNLILAGYGLMTFLMLMLNMMLLPKIMPSFFEQKKWTVGRQIMWLVWIVFGISVVNYGYSIATGIFRGAGWSGPILFIGFTLPVALIAIVIITFINQNLLLKKHLQLSDDINESIESHHASESNTQKLSLNSGNQKYDFNLDETLFLESQGNYVCVYSLDDKEVKKTMIRITMKQVLEQAQFEQLFKCHRAYVVNLNNVEKVEGNSHGIDVKMKGFDGIIPVSRNNTKAFKEAMA